MKIRLAVFCSVIVLAFVLLPVAVSAQTTTTEGINSSDIVTEMSKAAFWLTLLVTLVAGAVGGVVYELLMLQGGIESPHKPTNEETAEKYPYAVIGFMFNLGIWARIIIGALAAVAALFVLSPASAFGLVATALIAGSAGTAIFRSLQDRLTAVIAQKETATTKEAAKASNEKTVAALDLVAGIKTRLQGAAADRSLIEKAAAPGLDDLNKIERLLSEAKGVQEKVLK